MTFLLKYWELKSSLIFSGSETKENGQTRPPPPCHHGHNREDTVAAPNTDQKVNTWGSFKTKDHFLELHFRWTSSILLIFFGCHATSSYLIECLCLNRWKDWSFWYFINFSTGICVIFCICNIGNFFYTNVSTDCTSFLRNCCISGLCVNHVFNSCFNGV